MNISVSEAKSKFAELIRRVEAGEEIVLTRNGKPVARLSDAVSVPQRGQARMRAKGRFADQIEIAEDFDTFGPEWDTYLR